VVPLASPVSVKLVPLTFVATGVAFSPPAVVPRYTLYPVTGEPPSEAGAPQDSCAAALVPAATKACGAEGTVAAGCGVAEASLDCGEVPTALTAATL